MRSALAVVLAMALLAATLSASSAQSSKADPPSAGANTASSPNEAVPWEPKPIQPTEPVIEEIEDFPCWPRVRFSADYLYWWFKGEPVPPLVTTGISTDSLPGALGMPGTKILFGGDSVDKGNNSGVRSTLSWWFNSANSFGLEVSGLYVGSRTVRYEQGSDGSIKSPILSQPFFNVGTGNAGTALKDIAVVASPGVASGVVNVAVNGRF